MCVCRFVESPLVVGAFVLIIALSLSSLVMLVFDQTADTILYCFLVERDENNSEVSLIPHTPDTPHTHRDTTPWRELTPFWCADCNALQVYAPNRLRTLLADQSGKQMQLAQERAENAKMREMDRMTYI